MSKVVCECGHVLSDSTDYISYKARFIADQDFFDLKISERIIFYTEDIQVEAIVFYDEEKHRWFGKIDSEYTDMPNEIVEAREDGYMNGKFWGKWTGRDEIIRDMLKYEIPRELIMKITKVSEDRLKRLKSTE